MKKKLWSVFAGTAIVGGMALGAATPASAFPIYENINYGGYAYAATWAQKDGLGTMNTKASSLKAPATGKTFYSGRGYSGYSVFLKGNVANLDNVTTGLPWLWTWNDKIQAYK